MPEDQPGTPTRKLSLVLALAFVLLCAASVFLFTGKDAHTNTDVAHTTLQPQTADRPQPRTAEPRSPAAANAPDTSTPAEASAASPTSPVSLGTAQPADDAAQPANTSAAIDVPPETDGPGSSTEMPEVPADSGRTAPPAGVEVPSASLVSDGREIVLPEI